MEKLYTVSNTRLGDSYGSDHEHIIAKFRLKFKKVGKTTRPFRYNLNQIPYNYTVEVKWSEVTQSCPTLCDRMDCSLPGSSVHGILQARVLERVAISFFQWQANLAKYLFWWIYDNFHG